MPHHRYVDALRLLGLLAAVGLVAAGCFRAPDNPEVLDASTTSGGGTAGDSSPADTTPDTYGAPCSSHSDCQGSVCDPVENRCVDCTDNTHCSAPNPVCRNHRCTGCTEDSHCSRERTCFEGRCRAGSLALQPASELRLQAAVGEFRTKGFEVHNTGSAPIRIEDVRLSEQTGGDRDDNRELAPASDWDRNYELPPGESHPYSVEYTPLDDNPDRGRITVQSTSDSATLTLVGEPQ